jgi:hypothetical protein
MRGHWGASEALYRRVRRSGRRGSEPHDGGTRVTSDQFVKAGRVQASRPDPGHHPVVLRLMDVCRSLLSEARHVEQIAEPETGFERRGIHC